VPRGSENARKGHSRDLTYQTTKKGGRLCAARLLMSLARAQAADKLCGRKAKPEQLTVLQHDERAAYAATMHVLGMTLDCFQTSKNTNRSIVAAIREGIVR